MKNSIFFLCFLFLTLSININAQWVQVGITADDICSFYWQSVADFVFHGTLNNGVHLSTNNGTNWTQTTLNNRSVYSLGGLGSNVLAGTLNYGVYKSTDNGTNWSQTALNNRTVYSLGGIGNNAFAGTLNFGIYKSTDNGFNWLQTTLNNRTIFSLAVIGNNIFAGTSFYGVYLSTDNGSSWNQTSLNNRSIYTVAVNGNNIFAGTYSYGVYLSTDNGISWTQTSLNNLHVFSLAVIGNNIFAGTSNGTWVSNDNGLNWVQRNEGLERDENLSNVSVSVLCILNNDILASVLNKIYRRPQNELIGIHNISSEIPKVFSLDQNYPNPFNPSTKIQFHIPKSGFVNMIVYDILGSEIATLVNGELRPGTYEADWDASNYPSGVYYYKLTTGDFSETRKMVLVK